jgi:hypothetical protein
MEGTLFEALENRLKRLDAVISNKYLTLITSSSKNSNIDINFPTPLDLNYDFNYEIGLLWFSCYNTVYNIKKEINGYLHCKFLDSKGNTVKCSVALEDGAYELDEITKEINNQINKIAKNDINLIQFLPDKKTGKSIIKVKHETEIHFTPPDTFRDLLGFQNKVYHIQAGQSITSENIVQITHINTINIECDCISESYYNGQASNIIYSFPSNTVPKGYKIIERMNPPIYLPLNKKYISQIRIRIVDDHNNLINFNGEEICFALHLKQV